jgi:hypothetical protein
MAAGLYPQRVVLSRPGPNGLTPMGDATTPLVVTNQTGGAEVSDTNPQPTKGEGFKATVTVTRPANMTPYNAGDVIGDTGGSAIITLASMGLAGAHIFITSLLLEIDIAAIPAGMAAFRLHLYDAAPDAIADNAAWDLSSAGDRGKYIGYIDIAAPVDLGSTLVAQENRLFDHKKLAAASTTLYGLLQTIVGFTPAANSEVYKLTVRSALL